MTKNKEVPQLIEINEHESKCPLCEYRIVTNLSTKRSSKRTEAEQKRKHENLFWEHVRTAHSEVYVSVESN